MNGSPNAPRILTALVALAVTCVALGQKPGDLVVTPTRIVLSDQSKTGDITLVNRGSQTVRYRLTLVDMEMSEDGILKRTPSSDNSATSVLRLSPREVVLDPGVSQRVKIAAIFPLGMTDCELRSHLCFEPIASPKFLAQQASLDPPVFRLSFELRSVVTIPVIAQHGRLSSEAAISDAALQRDGDGWMARFKLTRTGTRSIRGDVVVAFKPAGGGAKIELGRIAALPVYFPNPDRIVTVRFSRDISSLGTGEFEISFAEAERSRGAATAKMVVEHPK